MPASIVLEFEGPASARPFGRGELGLFLDLVRRRDPSLSAELHGNERLKPFTLSPLTPDPTLSKGGRRRFWLRVTALDERLATVVADPVSERVRIGRSLLDLADVVTEPWRHGWAGSVSYERLLTAVGVAETDPGVVLTFHTPTAFASRIRNVARLFPEPALVFRSLGKRWNVHAGDRFIVDEGLLDELCDVLRVERYTLGTRDLRLGSHFQTKGCVGSCEYSVGHRAPREHRQLLRLLGEFAFFAGVGLRTTMGMGQVTLASRWSDTDFVASLIG